MSRCLPFPPPGYEKKARPDDTNLLIEEKQKEGKHKKDKKHKEKKDKEKKEKKEKGSSIENHREKKDRKKKHKDKKDKSKEKETKKVLKEDKVLVPSDHKNGEDLSRTTALSVQVQDDGVLFELEKRVRDDSGERQVQISKKVSASNPAVESQGKEFESNSNILFEGYHIFNYERKASNLPSQKDFLVNANGLENGFVSKSFAEETKNVEGGAFQGKKASEKQKDGKDKSKSKEGDGKGDKQNEKDKRKNSRSKEKKRQKEKAKEGEVKDGSVSLQNDLRKGEKNIVYIQKDRMPNPFEERDTKNGHLGKRKDAEPNGFLHGNEILFNALPKSAASFKVVENGSRTDTSDTGARCTSVMDSSARIPKLNIKVLSCNSVKEGSKTERKQNAFDIATRRPEAISDQRRINGISPSHATLPIGKRLEADGSNLQVKAVSFSHAVNEKQMNLDRSQQNSHISEVRQGLSCSPKLVGQGPETTGLLGLEESTLCLRPPSKLEPNQISEQRQGQLHNPKLVGQELEITGLKGLEKSTVCMRPPSSLEQSRKAVETKVKPPHPDAKYLSEILSVPKVEVPALDDQLWLFTSKDHPAKKPKMDSTPCESRQVWAESLFIEASDVTALPYVIPY